MEHIINKSFEKMISTYENTLNNFYPARGSSGFTEANQTHIYINALMHSLDDEKAVSWLEFPWESKEQHIDGFVYSPKYKSVFYIEAKRLSHTKKKQEIIRDIERLYCPNKEFVTQCGIVDFDSEFVIALSDVWLETKWKKSMPEWWCGIDNVPNQVKRWESKKNVLIKPESTICSELKNDWSASFRQAYWLGENVSSVSNYCLLMAASKI
ncbi:hypothetical protein [Aliivibrio logei]|uniref:Uncharacterized protein n=1 Tax=Aliivibrio logei TaxID=688 RepID=A0A1B9NW26_ALILO|nr:hypothetical protein [Aliivibrio logei]OCH19260.1 hypothetical protein A6E04_16840 [Aliivibrio logei]